MYLGRIVESGTHGRGVGDPRHPYTQALLRRHPQARRDRACCPPNCPATCRTRRIRRAGCRFNPRCPQVMDVCRDKEPELRTGGLLAARARGTERRREREPAWTAVRAAMAEAEVDALVLRPSPDFWILGGRATGIPRRHPDTAAETAGSRRGRSFPARRAGRRGPRDAGRRAVRRSGSRPKLVACHGTVLAPLRLRKRPHEIEAVQRAVVAAESVLGQARELAWSGATERAMARPAASPAAGDRLRGGPSCGRGGRAHRADPRTGPAGRVINPGDALLVSSAADGRVLRGDGAVFAVAEPPEDFEAMYSVVLAARAAALRGGTRRRPPPRAWPGRSGT